MLVLLFTVTFGVVLFLRQPERTPAAGLASIPITPQISPRLVSFTPAATPAAPPAESGLDETDALPTLPEMRPAAPPEYAYPENDVP